MGLRTRLRQTIRLSGVAGHLALGLAIVSLVFPWLSAPRRRGIQQRWSRLLLAILGVRLTVSGTATANGLLVANHISWLDIFVINAVAQADFVSKSDVRDWPLIGFLCAKTGTVFIERGNRGAARRVNQILTEKLVQGRQIVVFPEGTTSAGILPMTFRAALLQSAIDACGKVQPLALWYAKHDKTNARQLPAEEVAYCGETSLWHSFCAISAARGVSANLALLQEIPAADLTRRELAWQSQFCIHDFLSQTGALSVTPVDAGCWSAPQSYLFSAADA